jgi:hypothetical protein
MPPSEIDAATTALLNAIADEVAQDLNRLKPGISQSPAVREAVFRAMVGLAQAGTRDCGALRSFGLMKGMAAIDKMEEKG